jgi:hypothetical protein
MAACAGVKQFSLTTWQLRKRLPLAFCGRKNHPVSERAAAWFPQPFTGSVRHAVGVSDSPNSPAPKVGGLKSRAILRKQ